MLRFQNERLFENPDNIYIVDSNSFNIQEYYCRVLLSHYTIIKSTNDS